MDDSLGARIRAARAYAGITSQKTLGERIGVGREVVIALEADQRDPTVPEVQRIAAATGVPASFLLNGWAAPPELVDRIEALEQSVRTGLVDRDLLAREVEGLSERIEKRLATYARRWLQQGRQQPPAEGHTGEG